MGSLEQISRKRIIQNGKWGIVFEDGVYVDNTEESGFCPEDALEIADQILDRTLQPPYHQLVKIGDSDRFYIKVTPQEGAVMVSLPEVRHSTKDAVSRKDPIRGEVSWYAQTNRPEDIKYFRGKTK